jgi:hypothetical protein
MSDSMFDGSSGTGGSATSTVPAERNHEPPPEAVEFGQVADDDAPMSMLDLLRDRVVERETAEVEPWEHEIAKVGIRLICDPTIEDADYRRWVRAALPRTKGRRPRQPGALDIDQLALSARAIIATNTRVDVQTRTGWRPVTDPADPANVLTLDDPPMLRVFNVMDSVSLLRKLFGRDADVINAGQELLAAAGYLDSDDDDPE